MMLLFPLPYQKMNKHKYKILILSQLLDVQNLSVNERRRLIIGGMVDPEQERIFFLRGDGTSLIVNFNWFTSSNKPKPNYNELAIVDYGQTIKLGSYEVPSRSLFIDHDPEYVESPTSSNFMK